MTLPINVEAQFEADGAITVLSLTWQGRRLPVTGQGRQWETDGARHVLVMTAGQRMFELVYESEPAAWRVARRFESGATT